jgi:hypothetical protein
MNDAYSVYQAADRPRLVPSAVLFLDVLGTRDPPGGDEQAHLERTYDAFGRAQSWGDSARGATALTVATWFTDNLVMACPIPALLDEEDDDPEPEARVDDGTAYPVTVATIVADAVSLLVMYAALHQLALADAGLFARGAITLGSFYADAEFAHGRALNTAYNLESKCGIYPRVILDPKAARALAHPDSANGETRVTRGDDGVVFVDYLQYIDYFTHTEEQHVGVLRDHRDKVAQNLANAGHEMRLAQKYGWLASYHDDRAAAGMQVIEDRPKRRFPLLSNHEISR